MDRPPSPCCCPHCGRLYSYRALQAHLIPAHKYPEPAGDPCPGSLQNPRNPESDRRPLWKDGGSG